MSSLVDRRALGRKRFRWRQQEWENRFGYNRAQVRSSRFAARDYADRLACSFSVLAVTGDIEAATGALLFDLILDVRPFFGLRRLC